MQEFVLPLEECEIVLFLKKIYVNCNALVLVGITCVCMILARSMCETLEIERVLLPRACHPNGIKIEIGIHQELVKL